MKLKSKAGARLLAAVLCLTAGFCRAEPAKNLADASPFLPPDFNPADKAPDKQKKDEPEEVKFQGVYEIGETWNIYLFNTKESKGYWVKVGDRSAHYYVRSFNKEKNSIMVEVGGTVKEITLINTPEHTPLAVVSKPPPPPPAPAPLVNAMGVKMPGMPNAAGGPGQQVARRQMAPPNQPGGRPAKPGMPGTTNVSNKSAGQAIYPGTRTPTGQTVNAPSNGSSNVRIPSAPPSTIPTAPPNVTPPAPPTSLPPYPPPSGPPPSPPPSGPPPSGPPGY